MSPEAQRRAIAEVCGWKMLYPPEDLWWLTPQGTKSATAPDPLSDLNACAEMRDTLNDLEQARYADELIDVLAMDGVMLWGELDAFSFADATAPQHCEAFLKAKNPWTDQ